MTRVIAGEFGGRALTVPKSGTRPTTDRVREAIFSRLDHANALRGATALDLFAGSGALGLEALSRGAAHVTFVESALPASRVIEANIRALGAGTRATAVRERATAFLSLHGGRFDLVFIDPPYDHPVGDLAQVLSALVPRLTRNATVVLEGSRRTVGPQWPPGLEVVHSKDYGDTVVHYAHASGSVNA